MAMAANKPCIGVSTLGALARNMRGTDGIICPVMDARCSQVYTAIFKGEGNNVSRLTDDMAIKIDELEKKLEEYNMPIFFVGDGADLCYNSISKKIASVHKAAENRVNQSAASVCALAFEIIKREEDALVSAGELVPCYLRLPQAERELRKKNENKFI